MHKSLSLGCLVVSTMFFQPAWGEERRMGVVLESRGEVSRHPYNTPPSRRLPVKVLSSLHDRDEVELGPSSSLTVSVVDSASRVRLTGPLKFQLFGGKIPTGPGIEHLPQAAERRAVAADLKVNLDKLGGFSSRSLGTTVRVDRSDPELDLDTVHMDFQSSTLEVRVSPADPANPRWSTFKGTLIHGPRGRDRLKLKLPLEQGQACWVYWGDQVVPDNDSVQFTVIRVDDSLVAHLRAWEARASGMAEQLEVAEAYRQSGLYQAAERLLHRTQEAFPADLDWENYWKSFHEERRVAKY